MALTARDKGGGDFQTIPADLHTGVCYAIWDIGTHFDQKFGKSIHKVIIGWELPEVRGEFERDGKKIDMPRTISKRYRLSLHKKADLRKDLENWRGLPFTEAELKGFDVKKLLGVPCQIQVTHKNGDDGKVYANISGIVKAPKGLPKPTLETPQQFFSFEETPVVIPPGTPTWIMDLIKQSDQYKGVTTDNGVSDDQEPPPIGDDDVPF